MLSYIAALYEAVCTPDVPEKSQVQKMTKYLNFLGVGVEPSGGFLHDMRGVTTRADLFRVCATHLEHSESMPLAALRHSLQRVRCTRFK